MGVPAKINVATAAFKEIQSLSSSESDMLIAFVERLASNPYDNALLESAHAKGDMFASSITDRLYVYWSFDDEGQPLSRKRQSKIRVLGLARKTPGGRFAPPARHSSARKTPPTP
jgi:hypothetical protein